MQFESHAVRPVVYVPAAAVWAEHVYRGFVIGHHVIFSLPVAGGIILIYIYIYIYMAGGIILSHYCDDRMLLHKSKVVQSEGQRRNL